MRTTITLHGPVSITYLRNGAVRIVRGDEFLRLIHAAARRPVLVGAPAGEERSGIL